MRRNVPYKLWHHSALCTILKNYFWHLIKSKFLYLSLIGIILRWDFLMWELIFIYCRLFVLILVVFFFFSFFFVCCFFFYSVSAKFHLWSSSGDLPRPRIGMLSLVTVSPVITAFHSCCLSHHVFFDQVNLWPDWVGFETAIFWQCSPGTVETQRVYPLRNVVKEETTHKKRKEKKTKNYQDEDKKSAINKI